MGASQTCPDRLQPCLLAVKRGSGTSLQSRRDASLKRREGDSVNSKARAVWSELCGCCEEVPPSKEGPCPILCQSFLAPRSAWHAVGAPRTFTESPTEPRRGDRWHQRPQLPGTSREHFLQEAPHLGGSEPGLPTRKSPPRSLGTEVLCKQETQTPPPWQEVNKGPHYGRIDLRAPTECQPQPVSNFFPRMVRVTQEASSWHLLSWALPWQLPQ